MTIKRQLSFSFASSIMMRWPLQRWRECWMVKRRKYDDKFRASAVVMLEAAGYPGKEGALMAVAKHLAVPHNTLRGWYHNEHNPPPSELRQEKKAELTTELKNLAYELVAAMRINIHDANLVQQATTFGIVVDKWQLLEGKPTWRGEVIELIKEGKVTPEEVMYEFSDAPELAKELFEQAGLQFAGVGEAEA